MDIIKIFEIAIGVFVGTGLVIILTHLLNVIISKSREH